MKIIRVWLFFTILMCSSVLAEPRQTDSLTLSEALRIAVANYPTVEQSFENWQSARSRADQSSTSLQPVIDLEAGYTWLNPISAIEIPHSPPMKVYPEDNYDIHLVGRYLITDFGKTTSAIEWNRKRAATSKFNIDIAKANIAFWTAQSYLSIIFYRNSIATQTQLIENLEQHLSLTEKLIAGGVAIDLDRLSTSVRIDLAKNQRSDLENNMRKQEIQLNRLLMNVQDSYVNLVNSFQAVDTLPDEAQAVAMALRLRPELIAAREEEANTLLQIRSISLGNNPSVGAYAQWGMKNGMEPNIYAIRGNSIVGLKFQLPVFNAGIVNHKIAEAKAIQRSASARTRELERQIAAEVRQSISDLKAAIVKLQTVDRQIRLSQSEVETATARYRAGTIRNLDLLDAETTFAQVKLLKTQAEFAYTMTQYALAKAVGTEYWNNQSK